MVSLDDSWGDASSLPVRGVQGGEAFRESEYKIIDSK
jgi:hypothetical protein